MAEDWTHAGTDWLPVVFALGGLKATTSDEATQHAVDEVVQAIKEKQSMQVIIGFIGGLVKTVAGAGLKL